MNAERLTLHRRLHACAALLLLAWLQSGCVSTPPSGTATAPAPTLDQWLDRQLAPYLASVIATHPRLRDETFAVVRMRGGDIQPRIDGLTASLRRRLTDTLAAAPGVHMAWLPSADARHHRKLQGADCADSLRADFFIGIESSAEPGGRRRVAVRLLDAADGSWVDGLGARWYGVLRPAQHAALATEEADELLRGLRMLPFTAAQPDLAAAYFANNLSCLIRQRGLSEARVHVPATQSGPPPLPTVIALLDNYLSRLHQVRVTRDEAKADYRIRPEAHRIAADLYQIWVALESRDADEQLAGLDTAVYMRIDPLAQAAPKAQTRSLPALEDPAPRIADLRVLHTAGGNRCAGGADDAAPVAEDEPLDPDGCFLVEASAVGSRRIFMLYQTPELGLSRLAPGRCASIPGPAMRLPLPTDGSEGVGTLYALAVSDRLLESRLLAHLERLPDACDGEFAYGDGFVADWSGELDRLLAQQPAAAHWAALRLNFAQ